MSALCQKRTIRAASNDRTYWGMRCLIFASSWAWTLRFSEISSRLARLVTRNSMIGTERDLTGRIAEVV